jgi:hypothetical protein
VTVALGVALGVAVSVAVAVLTGATPTHFSLIPCVLHLLIADVNVNSPLIFPSAWGEQVTTTLHFVFGANSPFMQVVPVLSIANGGVGITSNEEISALKCGSLFFTVMVAESVLPTGTFPKLKTPSSSSTVEKNLSFPQSNDPANAGVADTTASTTSRTATASL